jgi:hypothetical protein
MNRRLFLGSVLSATLCMQLLAKQNAFNVSMNGELDDDLIIFKRYSNSDEFKSVLCYQMHNMTKKFNFGSHEVKSSHIPGYIKVNKNIEVEKAAITVICTANEREDIDNSKALLYRTHYKSTSLYVNTQELFPSLIPENNDVQGYPTWYLAEEEGFASNYYRLWENATVFNGFITHCKGRHSIFLYNANGVLMGVSEVDIVDLKPQQIIFKTFNDKPITKSHIFTEINNFVFNGEENTEVIDNEVRQGSITKVVITNENGLISIDLPYPCPYINTYYIQGVEIEK